MTVKRIILLLLICSTFSVSAQNTKGFPYAIIQTDVPAGFFPAGPFDKETRSEGMSANHGLITNKKLFGTIYNNTNVNAIRRVYVAVYIPKKHAENALECYVIEYKSKSLLNIEQAKLQRKNGSRFLKKDNYLFIIWSDGYYRQVNITADHLQKRWQLTDISHSG